MLTNVKGIINNEADLRFQGDEYLQYQIDNINAQETPVRRETTAYWDENRQYIPFSGQIIVYTDHKVVDGINYPAIKIGDGNAYVIDLPFVDGYLEGSSVTQAEKDFWNSKISVYAIDPQQLLIFTED